MSSRVLPIRPAIHRTTAPSDHLCRIVTPAVAISSFTSAITPKGRLQAILPQTVAHWSALAAASARNARTRTTSRPPALHRPRSASPRNAIPALLLARPPISRRNARSAARTIAVPASTPPTPRWLRARPASPATPSTAKPTPAAPRRRPGRLRRHQSPTPVAFLPVTPAPAPRVRP